MSIKEKLKKLWSHLNFEDIKNINEGGCGIFALEMYNLLKLINIKAELLVLVKTTFNYHLYKREASKKKKLPENSVIHIILNIDNVYLDSDGIYRTPQEIYYSFPFIAVPVTYTSVKNTVNQKYRWSTQFNRKLYEPIIKERFQKIACELKEADFS